MAPGVKTGGRKKGTPNKFTALAKDAIAMAAEEMGGVDRIVAWAKEAPENERAFWTQLFTKLIPVQLNHSGSISTRPDKMTDEELENIAASQQVRNDDERTIN